MLEINRLKASIEQVQQTLQIEANRARTKQQQDAQNLAVLRNTVAERDGRLTVANIVLSQKVREAEELRDEIGRIQRTVQVQVQQITVLQEQSRSQQTTISRQQGDILKYQSRVSMLEKQTQTQASDKQLVIQKQQQTIDQWQKMFQQQQKTMTVQRAELNEKQDKINQQDADLMNRQNTISNQNTELIEKKHTISRLNTVLSSKERTIDNKNSELVQRQNNIDQKDIDLIQKQSTIDKQNKVLSERQQTIDQKNQALTEQQNTIDHQNKVLRERQQIINQQHEKWTESLKTNMLLNAELAALDLAEKVVHCCTLNSLQFLWWGGHLEQQT